MRGLSFDEVFAMLSAVQLSLDDLTRLREWIASIAHPFDEAGMRAFIEQDYDRSGGYLSATNHFMLKGSEGLKGRLHEIKAPLLVIHGTSDPIFPVEHGAALADAIAGARLVRIEGGGHELHPKDWATIVAALTAHTQR